MISVIGVSRCGTPYAGQRYGRPSLLFVLDLDRADPVTDVDLERMLHPDPWDVVVRVVNPRDATLEALAVRAAVFPGKAKAREAGLSGPVPHGLHVFGAEAGNFFAWNPGHPAAAPTFNRRRNITDRWWRFLDSMRASGAVGRAWDNPPLGEPSGWSEEPFRSPEEL